MPFTQPHDATALAEALAAYLAGLDDPDAGAAIYDLYAEDAAFCCNVELLRALGSAGAAAAHPGLLHRRDTLSREAFAAHYAFAGRYPLAAMHDGDGASIADRKPRLGPPSCLSITSEGPDHLIAWFAARETSDARDVHLSLGLCREASGWKVGWLTLARAVEPWSYALGRAQTLADLAFADAGGFLFPRSWLDVAYYRCFARPEPLLDLLPDARFGCQSSSSCCSIGFAVEVPAETQAIIDAMPWSEIRPELAGTQLPKLPSGALSLKGREESCRFLDEHRHCLIHKALGRAPIAICATYPFVFMQTPDGVAVATSMACPSARNGLGQALTDRSDEIYMRMALNAVAAPDTFRLAPGLEVPWPVFSECESALQDCLGQADRPLEERLLDCELALMRRLGGEFERAAQASAEPRSADDCEALLSMLVACREMLQVDEATFDAARFLNEPLFFAAEAETMLRNMLHSKQLSTRFDMLTAHRMGLLLYVMALFVQAHYPPRAVPQRAINRLGTVFMHNKTLLAPPEGEEHAPSRLYEALVMPGFGRWILSVLPRSEGADAARR